MAIAFVAVLSTCRFISVMPESCLMSGSCLKAFLRYKKRLLTLNGFELVSSSIPDEDTPYA